MKGKLREDLPRGYEGKGRRRVLTCMSQLYSGHGYTLGDDDPYAVQCSESGEGKK